MTDCHDDLFYICEIGMYYSYKSFSLVAVGNKKIENCIDIVPLSMEMSSSMGQGDG